MRYEVTNNTKSPRVLYNVEKRGVMVPVGETRTIDLADHDVVRIEGAKGRDEVTLKLVDEAPKQAATKK